MSELRKFYRSDEWLRFTQVLRLGRSVDGVLHCAYCGKPIVRAYDAICHHKEPLTETNVTNMSIALNPDNIDVVHHACHNRIHADKLPHDHEVFLVYGAPLSGKSSWVETVREPGDLIVDMDKIWHCISCGGGDAISYVKPPRLRAVAFALRDELFRIVEMRVGKWERAYVIGGFPLLSERERLCRKFGAREVFIDATETECLERLDACEDGRGVEWQEFIREWFRLATPPVTL